MKKEKDTKKSSSSSRSYDVEFQRANDTNLMRSTITLPQTVLCSFDIHKISEKNKL